MIGRGHISSHEMFSKVRFINTPTEIFIYTVSIKHNISVEPWFIKFHDYKVLMAVKVNQLVVMILAL